MKKMKWVVFLGLFLITQGLTQNSMSEFNVGLLVPKDAKAGFLGGLNVGRMVDEKIGISLGASVYHNSYTKEEKVNSGQSGGTQQSTIATELEQSTTLIPLFFQFHYVGPISSTLDLKVTAGLGYEFLWNSYKNFEDNIDDSDFFSGFGWIIAAGVSIPISSASDFFGEVLYHGGAPSKEAPKTDQGFPARTEVDMSGVGIRVGIRLYNFGF